MNIGCSAGLTCYSSTRHLKIQHVPAEKLFKFLAGQHFFDLSEFEFEFSHVFRRSTVPAQFAKQASSLKEDS